MATSSQLLPVQSLSAGAPRKLPAVAVLIVDAVHKSIRNVRWIQSRLLWLCTTLLINCCVDGIKKICRKARRGVMQEES